jgi:hypothetical protein
MHTQAATGGKPGRRKPTPGGHIPDEVPTVPEPGGQPDQGPSGPRKPYPVDDPGINDPDLPGSQPDYLPGGPSNPMPRY